MCRTFSFPEHSLLFRNLFQNRGASAVQVLVQSLLTLLLLYTDPLMLLCYIFILLSS